MTTQIAPGALKISDVVIRQDDQGRYCLNDLHIASGGNSKHKPSNWIRTQQVSDLITEIEKGDAHIRATDNQAVSKSQGFGKLQGTFVVQELVYAYAAWISAEFHLKIIRAYAALVGSVPPVACPAPESVVIPLNLVASGAPRQRYLVNCAAGAVFITPVRDDEFVMDADKIKRNLHEIFPGQMLVDKSHFERLLCAVENIRNAGRVVS